MKKPKTMKLREKVAPPASKNKRHSRDDINSESRSRVCKKIRERKSSNRRYGSHSAFLGFISHISAEAVHDRVLSLSLARARAYREFYYAEKVSPEYRRCLLIAKSILTATPAYSSGNRIRSTMESGLVVYISDNTQA